MKLDLNGRSPELTAPERPFFLIGLLYEFANRLQTKGDSFFGEISWKQCFLLICLDMLDQPPTIRELAELAGSSHQNVKQLLVRLEKGGYVTVTGDERDRRKQRVSMTKKARAFQQRYDAPSQKFMAQLFDGVEQTQLENAVALLMRLDENLRQHCTIPD